MKNILNFCLIFISFAIFSCTESNVNNSDDTKISAIEAYKQVIKEVTISQTKGLSDVCYKFYSDSTGRESFLRTFIENIRLLDDNSIYFYIYDSNYVSIAHPILKNYIGNNHYDDQDSKGQFMCHIIQDSLRKKGDGFVEFYFDNPKTKLNEKKFNYVRNFSNPNYWIGCGVYEGTMFGWSIDKSELNKLIVKNCVSATATGLKDVFADLITNNSEQIKLIRNYCDSTRFLNDLSGYFFVDDLQGNSVSYPTKKELEGTNLTTIKDSKGIYPVVEMIKVINARGSGFVEYYLENPVYKIIQKKIVYVEKIIGTNYFIGCGYYEE